MAAIQETGAGSPIGVLFGELVDPPLAEGGPLTSFRFVDLFAGIGGMRLGFTRARGDCVYSCEIDRFARRTYEANFGLCEAVDIRDVDPSALGTYEVLAAGFPCQPFSLAGVSKKASLGRLHGFDDEKSGNLFFEIVRILAATAPPVVFLENVKNLKSHDGGNTFRTILGHLDALGYEVTHQVVDAQPWVPQHRERTFIVGLHRDAFHGRRFHFPPAPVNAGPRLNAILEDSWDAKYRLSPGLWAYLRRYKEKHQRAGNGFGFGLVGPDDVARTLSARYHKDGSEILIDIGEAQPRRLTPVECGRLMGFPSPYADRDAPTQPAVAEPITRFVIPVSDTQAYRQFGNAVVVDVIEHLAGALRAQTVTSVVDAARPTID